MTEIFEVSAFQFKGIPFALVFIHGFQGPELLTQMQTAHSFDLLGKKHKTRKLSAEEKKWQSAKCAYEYQRSKIEGLKKEVDHQIHVTRDLRWKVGLTAQLCPLQLMMVK